MTNSKIPKFDRAIQQYFEKLQLDERGGQWRACRFSGERFYVRPEDLVFYKRFKVPLPTLSPHERWRRKLAYCNSYNLFKISSAHSGAKIVAAYPPGTPHKIYEHQAWYGDAWNPFDYGAWCDANEKFFPQFAALQKEVPRPNLYTDTSNINSDYVNTSVRLKNCFLAFDAMEGENLYYFHCCINNRDCVDCDSMFGSEVCYECLRGIKLYKCFFCTLCEACIDSYFLSDCKNCAHCFGGVNLRNKKYMFFNEQLTKEEYEKRVSEVNLGDYRVFLEYQEKFEKLKEKEIHPALHLKNVANCTGDFLDDSKNCHFAYWLLDCENCIYCFGALGLKDCADVTGGTKAESCYEVLTISTEHIFEVKFSTNINESKNLEYCDLMRDCHDCFGCVGLNNKIVWGLHRSQSGIQVFDVNNALIFLAKSSFRWLNRYSISFRYQ